MPTWLCPPGPSGARGLRSGVYERVGKEIGYPDRRTEATIRSEKKKITLPLRAGGRVAYQTDSLSLGEPRQKRRRTGILSEVARLLSCGLCGVPCMKAFLRGEMTTLTRSLRQAYSACGHSNIPTHSAKLSLGLCIECRMRLMLMRIYIFNHVFPAAPTRRLLRAPSHRRLLSGYRRTYVGSEAATKGTRRLRARGY
eukprot:1182165-Prorocentrum_minimum.AAC.5